MASASELEKAVAPGKHGDEELLDDFGLSHNDLADLAFQSLVGGDEEGRGIFGGS
jgi:hypothetical protein